MEGVWEAAGEGEDPERDIGDEGLGYQACAVWGTTHKDSFRL